MTSAVLPNKIQVPGAVLLARTAWATITQQAQAVGLHETGGLLIGRRVSYQGQPFLVILAATGPGQLADQQLYTFAPDTVALQPQYEAICAALAGQGLKAGYLGEWHKHPPGYQALSAGDIEQGHLILQDSSYYLEYHEILLPIVLVRADKSIELHPYYLARRHPQPLELKCMVWEDEVLAQLVTENQS